MKASSTITNWMKAKYGKVPQDLDQHYDALTKELSSYGPINDVDHAALINHVSNMQTQGRPVQLAVQPVKTIKHPGMQSILAKMQAHGSQLPAKLKAMRKLPHLEDGGAIAPGQSAVVGDNQADPNASTPEVATNPASNPSPVQVQPAPQAASIPAGQDPNANGSAAQLKAAYQVASNLTGLSPQAVQQTFNPDQVMQLYQKYVDAQGSAASGIGRTMANFGANLGGAATTTAQNATNAVNDARLKDSILGPTLAAQSTLAEQQNQDRLNAPLLGAAATTAINQPTTNSTNATTQSTNALTQLGNQFAIQNAKDAQDPDSSISSAMRSISAPMLKAVGITLPDNISAAQINNNFGGMKQIAETFNQVMTQRVAQQNADANTVTAGSRQNTSQGETSGTTATAQANAKATQDARDISRETLQSVQQTRADAQRVLQVINSGQAYQGPGGEWLVNVNGKSQQLKALTGQVANDILAMNAHAAGGVSEMRTGAVALGEKALVPTLATYPSSAKALMGNILSKLNGIEAYHSGVEGYANRHGTINGYVTRPATVKDKTSGKNVGVYLDPDNRVVGHQ